MSTSEWTSSDLFDDIFGDELVDIYDNTVGDGSGAISGDIPELLPPPTSFNDLTTLPVLPTSTNSSTASTILAKAGTSAGAASAAAHRANGDVSAKGGKKRKAAPVRRPSSTGTTATTKKHGSSRSATLVSNEQQQSGALSPMSSLVHPPSEAPPVPLPLSSVTTSSTHHHSAVPCRKVTAGGNANSSNDDTLTVTVTPNPSTIANGNTRATYVDFESIAKEAVSNLMIDVNDSETQAAVATAKIPAVKKGASSVALSGKNNKRVNTSTEHIKALTGNNWVAACASVVNVATAMPGTASTKAASSDTHTSKASSNTLSKAKGGGSHNGGTSANQNLTPEERARMNRNRNREHARNTRLRKKAYVEEMKRTLVELANQRDAAEFGKRQDAQREREQREVRFRVLEEFLKLRGRNEPNVARWSAIFEEGFQLTLPLTTFREMSSSHQTKYEQILTGVKEVMGDAKNFSSFLQDLGHGNRNGTGVTFLYRNDRKNFFMDDCNAILVWSGTSVGATKQGATSELTLTGVIRGKFSPASNKLLSASISFDTGSILAQTQPLSDTEISSTCGGEDAGHPHQAVVAASLDSVQVARLANSVPCAVNVVAPSSCSGLSEDNNSLSDPEKGCSGDVGNPGERIT